MPGGDGGHVEAHAMPMIAIAGCDGAGKSTLVRSLAAALVDRGFEAEVVDKWDVFDPARYPECAFLAGGPERLKQCVSAMDGVARALFIFWMIALTLKPIRRGAADKVYLLDGYWMKHAAAEILLGCPPEIVLAAVNALPEADLTVFLDVPPATALGRKQQRSRYECGRGAETSRAAFASHQSKVGALLSEWARERGWARIDSGMSAERVLRTAVQRIERSLRPAPQAAHAAG
jgi:dTMP kinase